MRLLRRTLSRGCLTHTMKTNSEAPAALTIKEPRLAGATSDGADTPGTTRGAATRAHEPAFEAGGKGQRGDKASLGAKEAPGRNSPMALPVPPSPPTHLSAASPRAAARDIALERAKKGNRPSAQPSRRW